MSVVSSRKLINVAQASNPKLEIIKQVGDITEQVVLADLVLVGTYARPEKTHGGIIRPTENIQEDEWQGKVGLVLKCGPIAFADWEQDDGKGGAAEVGNWVVYSIKDGWSLNINGYPCRLIPYERLRMTVTNPEIVF